MIYLLYASVAQGIEHRFPKPCVAGSNPAGGVTRKDSSSKGYSTFSPLLFLLQKRHLVTKWSQRRFERSVRSLFLALFQTPF